MSLRRVMTGRNRRLLAALCLTMVVTSSCRQFSNVETIRYGREYSEDGERLRVAALQPRCACVSLANPNPEPVWVESWFYSIPRGSVVIQPNERRRFLFDWAGPENTDFYELVAFRTTTGPTGLPQRDDSGGLQIQQVLNEYTPVVLLACDDPTCDFGPLAMNRALQSTAAQQQQPTHQRGVTVASTIEVAAPLNRCGCMMLRNISSENSVTLRSTRHGATTGQITLEPLTTIPVPFDWGGPLDSDVYAIDAVAVEGQMTLDGGIVVGQSAQASDAGQPDQPLVGIGVPPGGEPQTQTPTITIRLRDYVSVVGQLVDMACTPEFAEFRAQLSTPQPGTPDAPTVRPPGTAADVVPADLIQCPWEPGGRPVLGMSVAYDPNQTVVRAAMAPAPAPEAAPALEPEPSPGP